MTFTEVRNQVVSGLESHTGRPVVPSEQIAGVPELPYCYYSTITPRASSHTHGLKEVLETDEGTVIRRSEPVKATMSFTFCGQDRDTEDGYIYGDDEALALAEKAHGFFLLNGHCLQVGAEDIVVNSVGPVGGRSGFVVEDTVRRYGFDVKLSYVRSDDMPATTIANATPKGDAHL